MNKKEIEDHKIVATKMDWCELASIIIDLEMEMKEFLTCLKKSEIKKYDTLIDIYETEKRKACRWFN